MLSIPQIEQTLHELGPWHFNIEVAPGIWTAAYNKESYGNVDLDKVGVVDPYEMKELLQLLLPDGGIKGRTFLDVGCNAGGYCFVAHELGAKACYGFDVRDHWIKQAEFIRSLKYPDIETIKFNIADVKSFAHTQRYDVVLFKGVFYHLPDPITATAQLCGLTERAIVIDSASRSDIPGECMAPWSESKTHVMSGVDGLAWFPGGPEVIAPILKWCGFPHVRVVYNRKGGAAERFRGRLRMVATRHEKDLEIFDAHQRKQAAQSQPAASETKAGPAAVAPVQPPALRPGFFGRLFQKRLP